jgi:hypothetical protein
MRVDRRDLQRGIDRFQAPEPAFDRLLRRRQQRERRRRIQAGVIALAIVGVTGALIGRSLLSSEPAVRQPASPPTCDNGTWDTPSPAGLSGTVLTAAATSNTDVYAVIQDHPGGGYSLLHHGTDGWSSVPAPSSGYFTIAAAPIVPGSRPTPPLWLLNDDAAWVLSDGSWSQLPTLPLANGVHARALSVADAQNIWVSTDGGLMLHLNGETWTASHLPEGDVASHVVALGPNDVWAGGAQAGSGSAEPFTAHWDGSSWKDVPVPPLVDSAVTTLAASPGDLWATVETSVSGGHPTTHLLHMQNGEWYDTATLQGDSYRFNVLAGGASGVWRYAWTTPVGPPTSIEHWTGTRWERTTSVARGWDLGGSELWQFAALDVTAAGADVVRMGERGIVDFRYTC